MRIKRPALPPDYHYRKKGEFDVESAQSPTRGDIDILKNGEVVYGDALVAWVHNGGGGTIRTADSDVVFSDDFASKQEALNMLVLRLCLNEY